MKLGGWVRHQNRRAGIDEPGHPRRDAGMRSGKAGCRIPADLKRGNGGEGTAQRRFCWPGAGGVGGAAGSAPDTFAVNAVPWMKRVRANGTLPPTHTKLRCSKRTEPFHCINKAPLPKANGTLPPTHTKLRCPERTEPFHLHTQSSAAPKRIAPLPPPPTPQASNPPYP